MKAESDALVVRRHERFNAGIDLHWLVLGNGRQAHARIEVDDFSCDVISEPPNFPLECLVVSSVGSLGACFSRSLSFCRLCELGRAVLAKPSSLRRKLVASPLSMLDGAR